MPCHFVKHHGCFRALPNGAYSVRTAEVTGAELPSPTQIPSPTRWALVSARPSKTTGQAARTDCPVRGPTALIFPGENASDLIDSAPDWVLWHHWPDDRIHHLGAPGRGLSATRRRSGESAYERSLLGPGRATCDRPPTRHHRRSRLRGDRTVSGCRRQRTDAVSEGRASRAAGARPERLCREAGYRRST